MTNCSVVPGIQLHTAEYSLCYSCFFAKSQQKYCIYDLKLLIFVNVSAADDMNWNALEWDRAAEELTWERVTLSAQRCIFLTPKTRVR